MKKNIKLISKNSIQFRLFLVMALMMGIMVFVNLFLYQQMSSMVQKVDTVYSSNVQLSDISDTLKKVEDSLYEYLNTRSTVSLENYYRYSQEYSDLVERLNDRNVDNKALMLEKNIRNMSLSYLKKTDETIQAKRGRNVESYRTLFDEDRELYHFINYYIYELDSSQFDVNSENYQTLLSTIQVLEWISILIIVLIFIMALLTAMILIREMIHPLQTLADTATLVANGNMDVEVPVSRRNDEIGIVTAAFSKMLESIRAYIAAVKEGLARQAALKEHELSMEANLKEAQLKYLQAQINPHFLFNSLNAGAQLAAMEDAEQTGIFLQRMSDFYRYNVKKTGGVSTIGEETEAVDNYIYILNVRFMGDIAYEKMIEPGLENVQIPTLCLQPLVENSVTHGIHDRMGRGKITLTAETADPFIQITVADNGAGMTQSQIAEIMKVAAADTNESDPASSSGMADAFLPGAGQADSLNRNSVGIGLVNVIRRLRLFYGQEDLLCISSEGKGMGTEVSILIPAGREENKEKE